MSLEHRTHQIQYSSGMKDVARSIYTFSRDYASRAARRPRNPPSLLQASLTDLIFIYESKSSAELQSTNKMSLQTPRILPAHLNAFHPSSAGQRSTHTIRILGTVSALRGDTATITCGNNGDVTLILKPDSHLQMGKMIEVVGKVADLDGGQVCLYWWNCGEESFFELDSVIRTRWIVEDQHLNWYLTMSIQQGLGVRVLGTTDWGNPTESGEWSSSQRLWNWAFL